MLETGNFRAKNASSVSMKNSFTCAWSRSGVLVRVGFTVLMTTRPMCQQQGIVSLAPTVLLVKI